MTFKIFFSFYKDISGSFFQHNRTNTIHWCRHGSDQSCNNPMVRMYMEKEPVDCEKISYQNQHPLMCYQKYCLHVVREYHDDTNAEFVLKGNSNEKMEHFETACEDIRDIGPKYEIVGHQYQHHESIPENFNQYCVKVIGRTG